MKKLIISLLLLSMPVATYGVTPTQAYKATALFSTTMAVVYVGTWYLSSTYAHKRDMQESVSFEKNSALKRKDQLINATNQLSLFLMGATLSPLVIFEVAKKQMSEIKLF